MVAAAAAVGGTLRGVYETLVSGWRYNLESSTATNWLPSAVICPPFGRYSRSYLDRYVAFNSDNPLSRSRTRVVGSDKQLRILRLAINSDAVSSGSSADPLCASILEL